MTSLVPLPVILPLLGTGATLMLFRFPRAQRVLEQVDGQGLAMTHQPGQPAAVFDQDHPRTKLLEQLHHRLERQPRVHGQRCRVHKLAKVDRHLA